MGTPHWALLRGLRIGRGLSIKEMADRMGIVRTQASRYDLGQVEDPDWSTVVKWARALDVSLDLLAYFTTHDDIPDEIALKAARLLLAGYSEAEIIQTLERRYQASG